MKMSLTATLKSALRLWARGDYRDVRFEIDTRIASEMKHGCVPDYHHLEFNSHSSDANALMSEGYLDAAAWTYMGMTESIGMHYELIDDSMGGIWPFFEECIENLGKCIVGQNLFTDERRKHVRYLAGWSMVVFEDFMVYYDKVLEQLCVDIEDLEIWKGFLESALAKKDNTSYGRSPYFKGHIQKRHSYLLEIMAKAGTR